MSSTTDIKVEQKKNIGTDAAAITTTKNESESFRDVVKTSQEVDEASLLQSDRLPPFIRSLRQILSNETADTIRWTLDGLAIQIVNMERMIYYVLPKYFRHTKYSSFQRQLNYFGFRKWTKKKAPLICTFSNEFFTRDEPLKTLLIERKQPTSTLNGKIDDSNHIKGSHIPTTTKDKTTTSSVAPSTSSKPTFTTAETIPKTKKKATDALTLNKGQVPSPFKKPGPEDPTKVMCVSKDKLNPEQKGSTLKKRPLDPSDQRNEKNKKQSIQSMPAIITSSSSSSSSSSTTTTTSQLCRPAKSLLPLSTRSSPSSPSQPLSSVPVQVEKEYEEDNVFWAKCYYGSEEEPDFVFDDISTTTTTTAAAAASSPSGYDRSYSTSSLDSFDSDDLDSNWMPHLILLDPTAGTAVVPSSSSSTLSSSTSSSSTSSSFATSTLLIAQQQSSFSVIKPTIFTIEKEENAKNNKTVVVTSPLKEKEKEAKKDDHKPIEFEEFINSSSNLGLPLLLLSQPLSDETDIEMDNFDLLIEATPVYPTTTSIMA